MKRLVLLGGGHSHVEVIRRLGMNPPRDTRIVLVSPGRHTPYSGMLPGFAAGHYGFHDCHIDLEPLCRLGRVEFRTTEAQGIDPIARRVLCSDGGAAIDYDVLSINVGATPGAEAIPGTPEHALPVKPVSEFVRAWDRIQSAATRTYLNNRRVMRCGPNAMNARSGALSEGDEDKKPDQPQLG
ncbi:MAG: hypothetical protein HY527_11900 [Betaproteobacteria bacterium]|nr:hypothetical protein [Betaproteobacteria bacterium]